MAGYAAALEVLTGYTSIGDIQRFYLRMRDMETTGASKLDNCQGFAKAFRVRGYAAVILLKKSGIRLALRFDPDWESPA